MRLVNIHSLKLETFEGQPLPYAILSHRWGKAELSFEDISGNVFSQAVSGTPRNAYEKLKCACRTMNALNPNLRYVWIDTCCIDKRSSAELSEAINSMYQWYRNAKVCLALLQDVDERTQDQRVNTSPQFGHNLSTDRTPTATFEESVWFKRAWTLQELLAPRTVHFFDRSWRNIGTKESLVNRIVKAIGVPKDVLLHHSEPREYSIASRMSWAAHRNATRTEDLAYSLLGVFNVNMALLYGEGTQSFARLQEEIIKRTLEPSFLLWSAPIHDTSLFATSPADSLEFKNFNLIIANEILRVPFALTNAGLEIELELVCANDPLRKEITTYFVLLKPSTIERFLYRVGIHKESDTIDRCRRPRSRKITILRDLIRNDDLVEAKCGLRVHKDSLPIRPYVRNAVLEIAAAEESPYHVEGSGELIQYDLSPTTHSTFNALMQCETAENHHIFMVFSFDFDFAPIVLFTNASLKLPQWVDQNEDQTDHWISIPEYGRWAKVKTERHTLSPGQFACKSVNREFVYITLPEFLSPPGWQLAFYMHFVTEVQQDRRVGMWQIAMTRREASPHKSIAKSFATDSFFANEASHFVVDPADDPIVWPADEQGSKPIWVEYNA